MRRNKKAQMVNKVIAIALGVAVLFILVVYGGGSIKKAIAGSTPNCNSDLAKCACFYKNSVCPSAYAKQIYNSEDCPQDTVTCTNANYATEVSKAKAAAKKADKTSTTYGTCCMAPTEKISDSKLKSPATTTS